MANVFHFQFNVPFLNHCVVTWLSQGLCVTWETYILPKFATVSTSTSLPCINVAWGGVEQWSDRNPKGTYQVFCKFRKYLKKTYKKI